MTIDTSGDEAFRGQTTDATDYHRPAGAPGALSPATGGYRPRLLTSAPLGLLARCRPQLEDVRQYIAQQEKHHRRMTFQEEFVAFLDRHEIRYDDRYIWR